MKISDHQQSWGLRKAPGRGRDDALLVVADFLKNFDHLIRLFRS
jgi:hypothetical protein